MKPKIWQSQVLPSVLWFVMLFLISRIVDQTLHKLGYGLIGKYLGYPGTAFILLSFIYSLRKKKFFQAGKLKAYLMLHEALAWIGGLLILVHAGIHMHALAPWVALVAMIIVISSGFTGGYLQRISLQRLNESREFMGKKGMSESEIEDALYLDSLTVDYMKKWRGIHLTITSFFVAISLTHILSVFWFRVA